MIPLICLSCSHHITTPAGRRIGSIACMHPTLKPSPEINAIQTKTSCPGYSDAHLERITFDQKQLLKVTAGIKTCTIRKSIHGGIGDTFHAAGELHRITEIDSGPLSAIAHRHYREEGYSTADELLSDLKQQYHIALPCYVHAHRFEKITGV